MSTTKIKFKHATGKWLDTSTLFVDANGKVNELTEDGFLVARHDISYHMQWDGQKPSQTVNHTGVNSYKW